MLTLYYAPDNASLILRLALEEAGLPYETVLVDRAVRAQKAPAYLALNPAGLIPTLITPQGALAETGACLLWLCDTHPEAGLGPATDHAKRGVFLRWLFYLSNTLHADLNRLFYAERVVPGAAIERHHALMAERLLAHLGLLEATLGDEPALFAPPSALALYLGPLLRWAALYPLEGARWLDLPAYPALERLVTSLEARPSVKAAARAEGLGDTPFSKPQLPEPPEGSPT
ncbi:MAG: glutathione S-transferase family protein [Pseudomonadota bacterium]